MARCSLAAAACRENLNTGCVKVKAWGECGTEWGLVGWSLAGSHIRIREDQNPGRASKQPHGVMPRVVNISNGISA